jgi:hypothetical protein
MNVKSLQSDVARAYLEGDRIVFEGATGRHSIDAASSDVRILAHWAGFVANQVRIIHVAAPVVERQPTRRVRPRHDYIVEMTQGGQTADTQHRSASAKAAIRAAREYWNLQDGRTRQCDLLPRSFRARRAGPS